MTPADLAALRADLRHDIKSAGPDTKFRETVFAVPRGKLLALLDALDAAEKEAWADLADRQRAWKALGSPEGTYEMTCVERLIAERDRLRAENAALVNALRDVRLLINSPGHDECENPEDCPWQEQHVIIAKIDKALRAAETKEEEKP